MIHSDDGELFIPHVSHILSENTRTAVEERSLRLAAESALAAARVEVSQLRANAEKLRELRGCLGAGPMDYEAFVDEFDRITSFPAAEPLGSTPDPPATEAKS
jgi:hypothetical protein